jgi:Nuclease-related domain
MPVRLAEPDGWRAEPVRCPSLTALDSATWVGLDGECPVGVCMLEGSEVSLGAKYCVGRAEPLRDKAQRVGRCRGTVHLGWEHRGMAPYLRSAALNYARRQQYRRLSRAGRAAVGSAVTAGLGLVLASAGAAPLAGLLLLTAVGLGLYARHWLSLAGRSRVGARSEDEVQRALAPLRAEGWRLRHSLPWQGRGDIDSVAVAPTGIVVAIETKTRTYDARHLARVRDSAIATLVERQTRYCQLVALPEGTNAEPVCEALKTSITTLPAQLRRSLTWDQGKEMAEHWRFSVETGVEVYFCDPRSPWQRGSNENTNGLLRQYFPKGKSLAGVTQAELDEVARKLNGRPRQTLGFRTPAEKLTELIDGLPTGAPER